MKTHRLLPVLATSFIFTCLSATAPDILPVTVSSTRAGTVVIEIYDKEDKKFTGVGTGWLHAKQDIVVTAKHVVVDDKDVAEKCRVVFEDGTTLEVDSVLLSKTADVAVLDLQDKPVAKPRPLMKFSDKKAAFGEKIYTIGHPFVHFMFHLSVGYVTNDKMENSGFLMSNTLLPGNSGGAVCNERGEVVGMAVAQYPASNTINLSISFDVLKTEVNKLMPK